MTKHQSEEGPNLKLKLEAQSTLLDCFNIGNENILDNPFLISRTGLVAKLLLLSELSKQIKDIPGDIMEFGVWYGQTLITLENLRAIHDTFNFSRGFFGFDTFEGYFESEGLEIQDSEREKYDTGLSWKTKLSEIFKSHTSMNRSQTELNLIEGDVNNTVPQFFSSYNNFVALAYVDIATYSTTAVVLNNIIPKMSVGGIIVIDDFGPQYPGVSAALSELDIQNFDFENCPYYPSKVMLRKK